VTTANANLPWVDGSTSKPRCKEVDADDCTEDGPAPSPVAEEAR